MKKVKFLAVIPARYGSTRLEGKPLLLIKNKPMVQWVYERVKLVPLLDKIIIATDDLRIYKVAKNFGAEVMMTSKRCKSGSDRVAEVVKKVNCDFVLNVQGDEPLISPLTLEKILQEFVKDKNLEMVTAVCRIKSLDEYLSPNTAKVVLDKNNFALYFSRSGIPFVRDIDLKSLPREDIGKFFVRNRFYKHLGVYGFKKEFLLKYVKMEESFLENIEKLEQLRVLENGHKIKVVVVNKGSVPVDTMEDLEKVRRLVEV